MRTTAKRLALAGALLASLLVLAVFCAACGHSKNPAGASALVGSTAQRARAILGHAPTGRAKAIVDKGILVVANDGAYPPQSYVDAKTRQLTGFDVEVAKAVAGILGLRITWVHPSISQLLVGLHSGSVDVAIDSLPVTRQRQKTLKFTAPYYYTLGEVFATKGAAQIAGPAGLAGKKVGVVVGSMFADYLVAQTTAVVKTYASDSAIVPALVAGNIDYWMTAAQVGTLAMATKPIAPASKPLDHQALAFAAGSGQSDLVALLNYAIAKMRSSGQLASLSKHWYGLDLTVAN